LKIYAFTLINVLTLNSAERISDRKLQRIMHQTVIFVTSVCYDPSNLFYHCLSIITILETNHKTGHPTIQSCHDIWKPLVHIT